MSIQKAVHEIVVLNLVICSDYLTNFMKLKTCRFVYRAEATLNMGDTPGKYLCTEAMINKDHQEVPGLVLFGENLAKMMS